jgi:hypothetical protein
MKQGRAGTMTHDYKRHGTTCWEKGDAHSEQRGA